MTALEGRGPEIDAERTPKEGGKDPRRGCPENARKPGGCFELGMWDQPPSPEVSQEAGKALRRDRGGAAG